MNSTAPYTSKPLAEMPEVLTVADVARVLRVGRGTAYALTRSGALPRVAGLGRLIRVPRSALEEFVK